MSEFARVVPQLRVWQEQLRNNLAEIGNDLTGLDRQRADKETEQGQKTALYQQVTSLINALTAGEPVTAVKRGPGRPKKDVPAGNGDA